MRKVIVHISQFRANYRTQLLQIIVKEGFPVPLPSKLTHQWFTLPPHQSLNPYLEIIRCLSYMFQVTALRNEHNIYEGIYVVGREQQVSLFCNALKIIIGKCEQTTRSAAIGKYYHALQLLRSKARKELHPYYWQIDKEAREEYIKNTSILRTKKKYQDNR